MSFFGQIICCSESGVYSIGTFGNRTGGTARAIRSKKLRNYWSRDLLLRHTSAFMVPRITDNPFFIIFFSLLLSTFNKTNVQCQLPYYWDKKAAQFRFITEGRGGGGGGGLPKFSNFKMSYLIQYLWYRYVHTVFGFQLLLTRSV